MGAAIPARRVNKLTTGRARYCRRARCPCPVALRLPGLQSLLAMVWPLKTTGVQRGRFPLKSALPQRREDRPVVVAAPVYTAGPRRKAHTIFNVYILIAMVWPLKTTGVQRSRFPLKSANRRSADKGWPPRRAARGDSRHDKIAGSNFEQRLRWPRRGESQGWDE